MCAVCRRLSTGGRLPQGCDPRLHLRSAQTGCQCARTGAQAMSLAGRDASFAVRRWPVTVTPELSHTTRSQSRHSLQPQLQSCYSPVNRPQPPHLSMYALPSVEPVSRSLHLLVAICMQRRPCVGTGMLDDCVPNTSRCSKMQCNMQFKCKIMRSLGCLPGLAMRW